MVEQVGYARLCSGEAPRNIKETKLNTGNAEVRISPIGATVTSWSIGETNLITYPKTHTDPNQHRDVYRGGIPILFPIAGAPGRDDISSKLKQHGFTRDLLWEIIEDDTGNENKDSVTFRLVSNDSTKAVFPFDFEVLNKITLAENSLRYDVRVKNSGDSDATMPYVFGFHPYFSQDQKDAAGITISVPGFETNPDILKNSIFAEAPSGQSTFSLPNKGEFTLKYSDEFRKLVMWTDNPNYICFEPWTSGPQTIDTDQALRLNAGETTSLFFEVNFESKHSPTK